MSESSTNGTGTLDPLGFWKTMRDTQLEAWSKMMVDVVNSDEYAKNTGQALEQFLATSQPFRNALERSMTQTLAMMNMPSRAEVTTLAERLVHVELLLDDMDAKLSEIQKSLRNVAASIPAAPVPDNRTLEDRLNKINARMDYLLDVVIKSQRPEGTRKAPVKKTTEKA